MRGMYGLGALVALAAMLVEAPAAVAGETPCVGTLPPGTYKDIAVPAGQFCVLNDSQVRGNVTVPFQAFLSARRNTIRGDVKGVENNLTIFLFDRNRVMGTSALWTSRPSLSPTATRCSATSRSASRACCP